MEKSAHLPPGEKDQGNYYGPPPAYNDAPVGGAPYPAQGGAQYPPQGGAQYPPQGGAQYPPQGGAPYPTQYPPQGYPAGGTTYPSYPNYPMGYQQGQYQQTSNTVVVTQPTGNYPVVTGPAPPDQMCAAIFVTLCCFWPTGIVAIMRASDARNALARGDLASAQVHSRSARSMVIISVVIGIIAFVVAAIIIGVYVGLAVNSSYSTYNSRG
ncbi:proline-rich transmembrane protein 1-like [Physella acuta]|uniref:proline-rich transmembrane protein 1-like n=1 Tax=Physella acuta TaxID=109671 RepID=UPI0027DAE7F0|nr:proline-rich transmembrane protein 1-like [Physella acuta]